MRFCWTTCRGVHGLTILLVDLLLDIEVDASDDDVGDYVERAHAVQHIRVIKRNLLRDLHKSPRRRIREYCQSSKQDEAYKMRTRLELHVSVSFLSRDSLCARRHTSAG